MAKEKHEFGMSLAISLLLFLHLPFVRGYIETIKITDDSREYISFEHFGFTTTGHLSISVSSIKVTPVDKSIPTNASRFGFYTAPIVQDVNPSIQCKDDNRELTKVFTFSDISPPPQSSLSKTISVTKPGNYVIVFGNCVPGSKVSMLVHIEAYNLDARGQKNYLSDGDTYLPTIHSIFSLCYVPFILLWLYICHSKKPFVRKIHILMGVLLVIKALNQALAAEENYHIQVWGSPRGWDTVFNVSRFIKSMLLFTVTLLIGTGWSFVKPSLQEREKWILKVGIPLQVFVNIAYIIFIELKYYDLDMVDRAMFWLLSFLIADTICASLIFVSISWSMRSIRETAKVDGKAASNLKKMRLFKNFYISVLVFFVFNNYVMPFVAFNVGVWLHNYVWVCVVVMEITSLVFYIYMFYLFQPLETNQYFALPPDVKDEEAALTTINSSEFKDFDCVHEVFSFLYENYDLVLFVIIIIVLFFCSHKPFSHVINTHTHIVLIPSLPCLEMSIFV